MDAYQPDYIAIAFDLGLPTFRHEADDTYKADRPETPQDFITDLKYLQELLGGFNISIFTAAGYEADDVLASISDRAIERGCKVKIVTGDRDLFQLIDDKKGVGVLHLGQNAVRRSAKANADEFGAQQVQDKMGISPTQIVDYKALCGDKSDNIPGVQGIGHKTAIKLLAEHGSLDNIYTSLDKIKGATRKKLEAGKDAAYHSQYMARIVRDAPIEFDLEACKLTGFDTQKLVPLLQNLEFHSFLGQITELQRRFGGSIEAIAQADRNEIVEDEQLSFFSAEDTENARNSRSCIEPRIIDTPDKLEELVRLLKQQTDPDRPVAWDTETTDLEPRDADLVGIGCCWGDEANQVAYIPCGHKHGRNLDRDLAISALRPILESSDYPKVLQNAKFDRLVFRTQGIQMQGVVFETMLASYILNPEGVHNLNDLSTRYLNITALSYSELVPKGKTIADLDIESVAHYCGMDAYTTFLLVPKLRPELEAQNVNLHVENPDRFAIASLYDLLVQIEQPLEPVLAEMEYTGIRIDCDYLANLSQQLQKKLETIETQAYEAAGGKFNLNSPKQLSEILFDRLGLNKRKSRKTKTGYSTDAKVLEKLRGDHPVIDAILENRTLSKLKSTYVDALPKLVRSDTERIHTDFNQTITATGRLSSSEPNLQNIPIRTEFSRQIRKAFVPEPGWLLVGADYSQIELRILAHLSREPVLVDAYRNHEDVHTLTAKLLFEKDEVTSEERRLGKTINFGVIYGMGAQRFAREAKMSVSEGKTFIERFNERYPKVFEYLEGMKKVAIAQGYVETILGRRRYFNFSVESLRNLKGCDPEAIDLEALKLGQYDSQLLRAAANAPIQGSSADIIKIAMVKLHELLQNYQSRLLLQVHDELIFEVPPDEWETLKPQIESAMISAVDLSVPLKVEVNAGRNWMETK
jgi:DNA polymerase-1